MCGGCLARQAGLAQVTNEGAEAFHWERRCRVLLRDILRLGTATGILLGFWSVSGPVGSDWFPPVPIDFSGRIRALQLCCSSTGPGSQSLNAAHRGSVGCWCWCSGSAFKSVPHCGHNP